MNVWHDISPEVITPKDFTAVIEIPKGSSCKYEMDKDTGMLRLDRVLYTSTHYPANYGFIPRTFADDGDPLDVLVLCSEPIEPLSLVRCYPIGVMRMIDNGKLDEKIISADDRLRMSELAFSDLEKTEISDFEVKNGGRSYTYLTLREFKSCCDELFFLVGTDMFLTLDKWKNPEAILSF